MDPEEYADYRDNYEFPNKNCKECPNCNELTDKPLQYSEELDQDVCCVCISLKPCPKCGDLIDVHCDACGHIEGE